MLNHPIVRMGQLALAKYQRDDVGSLAAALAYFTIFSFFPLILVTISLVGYFVDPGQFDVQQQLLQLVGSPELRALVTDTLEQFRTSRGAAGLIGLATLMFAASGIFGALDRAFDVIWEAKAAGQRRDLKATVISMLVDRLVAFGLLILCAALILAAVLGNVVIGLLGAYTDWLPESALLMGWARQGLTIALIALALAVIYRALPRPHAAWGDVWAGALVAALAFAALQALTSLIFSFVNFSAYGAIGGAMTLLMWIFLCAQIILVGGELTYAWAYTLGSRREA